MEIPSLAFRTDLALARLAGSEVEDLGSHVMVRTPDNPDYYWGNYLLLPHGPTVDELAVWENVSAATFPRCRHRSYGVAGLPARSCTGSAASASRSSAPGRW